MSDGSICIYCNLGGFSIVFNYHEFQMKEYNIEYIKSEEKWNKYITLMMYGKSKPVGWLPIESIPNEGTLLLATYAPTNWAYMVQEVTMYNDMPERLREIRLKHARAWMLRPEAPPDYFMPLEDL